MSNSESIRENAKTLRQKLSSLQKSFTTGVEKSLDQIDNTLEIRKINNVLHYLETKVKLHQRYAAPTATSSQL
jgi:hypothetical protein